MFEDKIVALSIDENKIAKDAFFKLSYGLFVLTAKDNDKDNGCIINTVTQITEAPNRTISIAVNKSNYTHDIIKKTGEFNVSVISEKAKFDLFERFGFTSGRNADKFSGIAESRTSNGIRYINDNTNAVLSAKVLETVDCITHTLFIAAVTEAVTLSDAPSATYAYYHKNIKPQPNKKVKGYVCTICGYVHEEETLPDDFICPWCKHGAEYFEPIE